jgi:hypothetical protein
MMEVDDVGAGGEVLEEIGDGLGLLGQPWEGRGLEKRVSRVEKVEAARSDPVNVRPEPVGVEPPRLQDPLEILQFPQGKRVLDEGYEKPVEADLDRGRRIPDLRESMGAGQDLQDPNLTPPPTPVMDGYPRLCEQIK